jgi:MurNAc alpha-1-phosphate uridylyltransferase
MPADVEPDAPPRPLKALILAAGRGERMRPLTDSCPKPLLTVRGRPLIEWHLRALARDGVREVVINVAWLGQQLVDAVGDGSRFGLHIRWSREDLDPGHALETAGGIAKALPALVDGPDDAFWLVSGDIFAPGFLFDAARARRFADDERQLDAHLWLVPNPPYHPAGDFGIGADGHGLADGPGTDGLRHTYANLALVRARLCADIAPGTRAALGPLLFDGMRRQAISVSRWDGEWHNVGTPAQLAALDEP